MITKADDYAIHQTADPISCVGTSDRNFYDRYFFNGYARDGSIYFAAAMGSYPNRQVMDASFSIVHRGRQYVVRASRRLPDERMQSTVGPLHIEVIEPLTRLRLRVEPNPWGIEADLLFTCRAPVIEEPRFFRRVGARVFMDYTRLTQHGDWSGSVTIEGERIDVSAMRFWGSRDRSWGIRPLGEREGGALTFPPQFFWLWAPINFEDLCTHFDVNEESDGRRWHETGVMAKPGEPIEAMQSADYRLEMQSGTRHARAAEITLQPASGAALHIELKPLFNFYMIGLGYGHPEWGHGIFVGEDSRSGESFALADVDPGIPLHLHVQAVCEARLGQRRGIGILEQLILGPHQGTGFNEIFDLAP